MSSKLPTLKRIAWLSAIPQISVMLLLIAIAAAALPTTVALYVGAGSYLLLSQGLRRSLTSAHRRGISLLRRGLFDEAMAAFHQSYEFFSRYSWLDRTRYLTLLSSSVHSYREMALFNIAFIHAQIGRHEEAAAWYQRAFDEFPHSSLPKASSTYSADS